MVPYRSRNSSAINSAGPRKKENLAIWIQRRGNKVTRTYRTPIKRWIVFLGKASLFPKEETHMKKSLVFAMAMALGVTATAFAANPFSDVPAATGPMQLSLNWLLLVSLMAIPMVPTKATAP